MTVVSGAVIRVVGNAPTLCCYLTVVRLVLTVIVLVLSSVFWFYLIVMTKFWFRRSLDRFNCRATLGAFIIQTGPLIVFNRLRTDPLTLIKFSVLFFMMVRVNHGDGQVLKKQVMVVFLTCRFRVPR